MSKKLKRLPVARWVAFIAFCFFAGFFAVIVIPNFVRATHANAANACVNTLRQLDSAKEQWKLENHQTNGAVVAEAELKPYIRLDASGNLPTCPGGGRYLIGRVGEDPKCSIGTSAWPNNHVLNQTNNWRTDFIAAYGKVFGFH